VEHTVSCIPRRQPPGSVRRVLADLIPTGHVRLATHVSGRKAACKILPALHQDPTKPVTWDQTIDAVEAHKEVVLLKALSGIKFSGVVELEGVIERDGWT